MNARRAVVGSMHIDRGDATDSVASHGETRTGDRLHKEERGEPNTCEITAEERRELMKPTRRPADGLHFPLREPPAAQVYCRNAHLQELHNPPESGRSSSLEGKRGRR